MKRKPPKGKRCDASVCVDYSSGAPRVHRCPNEATVEARVHCQFSDVWLCEDCATKIEASDA